MTNPMTGVLGHMHRGLNAVKELLSHPLAKDLNGRNPTQEKDIHAQRASADSTQREVEEGERDELLAWSMVATRSQSLAEAMSLLGRVCDNCAHLGGSPHNLENHSSLTVSRHHTKC